MESMIRQATVIVIGGGQAGLGWTPYARAAKARGALNRRPMFSSIDATGVIEADGSHTDVNTILWATGFKPALAHLDPLGLRNELGAIQMDGTQVAVQPRLHLIGYGPANRRWGLTGLVESRCASSTSY